MRARLCMYECHTFENVVMQSELYRIEVNLILFMPIIKWLHSYDIQIFIQLISSIGR